MPYCTSFHHSGPRYFSQPTAGKERCYDGRGRPPSHCPDCDRKIAHMDMQPAYWTDNCIICGNGGLRRNAKTCSQGCRSRLHQVRRRTA